MADQYVAIAPDSTGKKVDTSELTVSAQTVERQRINIADPTLATGIAAVSATLGVSVNVTNTSIPVTGTFWQATQPVSGTVTVQQSTASSLKVDLSGTAANATAIKVDGSAVTQPVSIAATVLVADTPVTSGGVSCVSSNATALTLVKSSAGQLYGIDVGDPGASAAYVQIFNASATGSVTLGTTVPLYQTWIPATGGRNIWFGSGIAFGTGIVVAITTTRTGSTAPGTPLDWNVLYK